MIDIPVMGYDGNRYSEGYLLPGDIPSFQYLDYNTGETIDLFNHHTNQWANNELYLLGSLKNTKLLPEDFTLSAYPNPFNPSTNLQFSVPYNGIITLAIFNIYGQTIAELANEYIAPGIYEITWDAQALPSGVYFARLTMGNTFYTQKLVLMK